MTNSSIKINADFIVNCTYNLSTFDEFNYLTISKDNEEFYRLFNESISIFQEIFLIKTFLSLIKFFFKDPIVENIPGINATEKISAGILRIKNSTKDSEGLYECLLSYQWNNTLY